MPVAGAPGRRNDAGVRREEGDVHPICGAAGGSMRDYPLEDPEAKDGYKAAQISLVEFVKGSKVKQAAGQTHFTKSNVPQ